MIVEYKDEQELIGFLKDILGCLPVDYFSILSYLIHFLSRVASHSQSNQMPMENLATIFGPCVFRYVPPQSSTTGLSTSISFIGKLG